MSQIPEKTPKDAGIPSKIKGIVAVGDQKYILTLIAHTKKMSHIPYINTLRRNGGLRRTQDIYNYFIISIFSQL